MYYVKIQGGDVGEGVGWWVRITPLPQIENFNLSLDHTYQSYQKQSFDPTSGKPSYLLDPPPPKNCLDMHMNSYMKQ